MLNIDNLSDKEINNLLKPYRDKFGDTEEIKQYKNDSFLLMLDRNFNILKSATLL